MQLELESVTIVPTSIRRVAMATLSFGAGSRAIEAKGMGSVLIREFLFFANEGRPNEGRPNEGRPNEGRLETGLGSECLEV